MREFLDRLASKDPVPGGGSVAALSGVLASCLGLMVCNLSDIQNEKLENLRKDLEELIKKDEDAFNGVIAAYKSKNKELKKEALKKASIVPLKTSEKSLEVLRELREIVEKGKKSAITDIGVAALLADSGIKGAILNIKINIKYIKDEVFVREIEEKYRKIEKEGEELKKEILSIVEESL